MLNRYPNQTRARKGFALIGVIFLIFGFFMMLVESIIGVLIGILFGLFLLLPSIFCGEVGFKKFEKIISRIALFVNLP